MAAFPLSTIAGAVAGVMLWFVLLQPLKRIIPWIVVNTIGWGVGFGLAEIIAWPVLDRLYLTLPLLMGLVLAGVVAGVSTTPA